MNVNGKREELIKSLERTPIKLVKPTIEPDEKVDKYTLLGKLNQVIKYLNDGAAIQGTVIDINDVAQTLVKFTGDPQAQLDALNTYCDALDATKVDDAYVNGELIYKSSAMANRLKFNQLFDTANSTLPTANGLTVTNIYGGHHVVGTTDHQYYHKMYDIGTTQGHWYYFAPNFSNTKSVYILGHIDGTAFSTNKGKVFEGGSKFDAYIQIEKDKTMDFDVQPILVDLTEMFGKGNEPSSVDELYKYIVKGQYYPYVDTPTKEEINNNMVGSYSDTTLSNVIKPPTSIGQTVYFTPARNGYIKVNVATKTSGYTVIKIGEITIKTATLPEQNTSFFYYLPKNTVFSIRVDNVTITTFQSEFIVSKEI